MRETLVVDYGGNTLYGELCDVSDMLTSKTSDGGLSYLLTFSNPDNHWWVIGSTELHLWTEVDCVEEFQSRLLSIVGAKDMNSVVGCSAYVLRKSIDFGAAVGIYNQVSKEFLFSTSI